MFVGTLYPLALEALTGAKISVGPPFFNATFAPLFVPLSLAMPFGPLLGWKRGDLLRAGQRLTAAAFIAAVAIAAAFALQHGGPVLAPFGVGLALFVMAGALIDLAERTLILRVPLGAALRRAAGLPRSAWGTAVAHFGIGVTLLGIVVVTAWGAERIAALKPPGDTIEIAHYRLSFDGLFNRPGPNYRDVVGRFTVRRTSGDLLGVTEPSRRTFPAPNMATTEAALMRRGVSQLYLSLGDPASDGTVPVRLYFKPAVHLARCAGYVCRRRPLTVRPAAAHRRAAPCQNERRRSACRVGKRERYSQPQKPKDGPTDLKKAPALPKPSGLPTTRSAQDRALIAFIVPKVLGRKWIAAFHGHRRDNGRTRHPRPCVRAAARCGRAPIPLAASGRSVHR